jgi:uncharacterized cupin superfamily protein
MGTRHPAIVDWREIENEPFVYAGDDEPMCRDADYSDHLGLNRLGIHHVRIDPGHRTSFPHAESAEEEFVYVISGHPDVWLDGHLHPLQPGDAVGFPPGTGLAHSFLNNSAGIVELLVVGDRSMDANRIVYPMNPERQALRSDWWNDAPQTPLGPHDGMTDERRARKR